MLSSQKKLNSKKKSSRNLWFERLMAVIASVNLGIVLFDITYVPWRDLWLKDTLEIGKYSLKVPITNWYDPIKGIEPHRETQKYLNTVNTLEEQVAQTGLQSSEVQKLLQELRNLSTDMIETNPFEVANKTGTLEKIKNRIRDRINQHTQIKIDSSRQAFATFWSQPYLSQQGWIQESNFFNQEIRPLIETNYYRHIGENGQPINRFWLIDLPFVLLFGLELGARSVYLRNHHTGINLLEAMLWRWYDGIFLVTFFVGWHWLRIIPVTVRLYQSDLLNLDSVRKQVNRGLVANFAEEITQVVVVRVINQMQEAIKDGEITRWLSGRITRPYIDINNTNEVEAIAKLLVNVTVYQVIPKVQPDLEAILQHNLEKMLKQTPFYQGVQQIPGLGQLPTELTERLVKQVSQSAYSTLVTSLEEDPVGAELANQLVKHFSEALASEVQTNKTIQIIQSLLLDMLEEIKLNYVESLSDEEFEQILEETKQIGSIKTITKKSFD